PLGDILGKPDCKDRIVVGVGRATIIPTRHDGGIVVTVRSFRGAPYVAPALAPDVGRPAAPVRGPRPRRRASIVSAKATAGRIGTRPFIRVRRTGGSPKHATESDDGDQGPQM